MRQDTEAANFRYFGEASQSVSEFMKRIYNRISLALASLGPVFSVAMAVELVLNPYESVDWGDTDHSKAQFHAHTTASDGSWNPHQVVDRYHDAGYRILAITDHDTHSSQTSWPWTSFDDLVPSERSQTIMKTGEYRGQKSALPTMAGDLEYENRDPVAMNMIAVEGNEITRTYDGVHCHVLGLFSGWNSGEKDITDQLTGVSKAGGLAILAHPAFSWTHRLTPGRRELEEGISDKFYRQYATLFRDYPQLIAMEVAVGSGSPEAWPHDVDLWDRLLEEFMPERPIFGMATDDFHSTQFGMGWAVFPQEISDAADVRSAMENGAYYFSKVDYESMPVSAELWKNIPVIRSIRHDEQAGILEIDAEVNGEPMEEGDCVWIGSQGEAIQTGLRLAYRDIAGVENFGRAELQGPSGTTYTNPFGFVPAK